MSIYAKETNNHTWLTQTYNYIRFAKTNTHDSCKHARIQNITTHDSHKKTNKQTHKIHIKHQMNMWSQKITKEWTQQRRRHTNITKHANTQDAKQDGRTILESEIPEVNWLQSRYDQLCMMDEKRLKGLYHIQGYQRRLRKAFDKKVRTRDLKLGDLVLKEIRALIQETNRKFKQNWASIYIIKHIYSRVATRLMDLDANPFTESTNTDQFKKFHIWGGSLKAPCLKWL